MKVIYSDSKKVNWQRTDMHVVKAENHSEVTKKDSVYLLPVDATGEKTEAAVYVPGYKWKSLDATHDNAYIYFALENYSFFQTATDIIEQDKERKGVFRFRRIVSNDIGTNVFAGDLYVVSKTLGEPEDIFIKQTDETKTPQHMIALINFGSGTMAHFEYTVDKGERIELEWSGKKSTISFDSHSTNPFEADNKDGYSLKYSVDSIIAKAHPITEELIQTLNKYDEMKGGDVT